MNEYQHDAGVAVQRAQAEVNRLATELEKARLALSSALLRKQRAIDGDLASWRGTPGVGEEPR